MPPFAAKQPLKANPTYQIPQQVRKGQDASPPSLDLGKGSGRDLPLMSFANQGAKGPRQLKEDPVRQDVLQKSSPDSCEAPSGGPSDMEAALMARHIYGPLEGQEEEEWREQAFGGWELDRLHEFEEEPGFRAGVYSRTNECGEASYAMVNRGTVGEKWSEEWIDSWGNNIRQPFGGSEHMEMSLEIARELNEEVGPEGSLSFVGHSKGGGEAAGNALATNRDAVIFNTAAINAEAYGLDVEDYNASMRAYEVRGDVLAATTHWGASPIDQHIMLPRQEGWSGVDSHRNYIPALEEYQRTRQ